jgi:hypothetical protein
VTVAPGFAAAAARVGHTIKNAQPLTLNRVNSGGNGAIDFWTVHLIGGDQMQIATHTPNLVGCCTSYYFELFKPGTTDANFPQTPPVTGTATPGASTEAILTLQAPYTGTFIFAVCENVSGDCRNVDAGGGTNPMGAYTFTPTLVNGGIKPGVGAKETRASPTIAKAPLMPVGNFEAGGGDAIDFWQVHLIGGDQVQISATTPYLVGCCTSYYFELFKPGTTDTNFPQTAPVMGTASPGASTRSTLTLQAPYTGTFLLAVCENVSGDCRNVDAGGGTNPMGPYTFTPTLVNGGIKSGVGAKETRASPTIAKAPLMPVGNFEAGGGGAIDFWKVPLFAGDKVQIAISTPYLVGCCTSYFFELFKQGTTDTNFPQHPPVVAVQTPGASTEATLDIQVSSTETYLLAVCENVSGDCRNVDAGGGTNPMGPYTFKDTLIGGHETRTSLKLSSSTVTDGQEKSLSFNVTVTPVFSGHPAGTVTISAGPKKICTVTLAKGQGKCSPGSNTLLAPGTYKVVAAYAGGKGSDPSSSTAQTLTVKKA